MPFHVVFTRDYELPGQTPNNYAHIGKAETIQAAAKLCKCAGDIIVGENMKLVDCPENRITSYGQKMCEIHLAKN